MKFRAHINMLLSFLILFSNIGLAFNVHYCHGKVSQVKLAYRAEHCGPSAEKQKKQPVKACCAKAAAEKKCCKNHTVKLQDKTEKTIVKSLQLDLAAFYVADGYAPCGYTSNVVAVLKSDAPAFYTESNAPPLYKLYCQYVLYA